MKEAATWSLLPQPRFYELIIYMIRSRMAATALSLSQEKLKTMLMQNHCWGKRGVVLETCKWRMEEPEKKTSGSIKKYIVRVLGFS